MKKWNKFQSIARRRKKFVEKSRICGYKLRVGCGMRWLRGCVGSRLWGQVDTFSTSRWVLVLLFSLWYVVRLGRWSRVLCDRACVGNFILNGVFFAHACERVSRVVTAVRPIFCFYYIVRTSNGRLDKKLLAHFQRQDYAVVRCIA